MIENDVTLDGHDTNLCANENDHYPISAVVPSA